MIVYLSFGELPSWLALESLPRLVSETGIEVELAPLLVSLGNVVQKAKPGEDDPLAEYKVRRARARRMTAERERERMCEMLGIDRQLAERTINPLMLSLGLLWLKEGQHEFDICLDYAVTAFRKTFIDNADVESEAAVTGMLESMNVTGDGFGAFVGETSESFMSRAEELLENGILSAPAFIVDGEIFHGREHLPLITWMLTGGQGRLPTRR